MIGFLEEELRTLVGRKFNKLGKEFEIAKADNFAYTDPVDKSTSTKQVI